MKQSQAWKEDFQMLIRTLSAFAFVPSDELSLVFEQLAAAFQDEPVWNGLLTYFEPTRIREPQISRQNRNPCFLPQLWNNLKMLPCVLFKT